MREPQDDIIVIGTENFTLPCEATTDNVNSTFNIVWQHNGSWIIDFDRKHYVQLADGSLFFKIILPIDVGRYACAAVVTFQNNKVQLLSKIAILQAACN